MNNKAIQDFLASATELSQAMKAYSPSAMGPWQIIGFLAGCSLAGIEPDGVDDEWLAADFLDEIARKEGEEEPDGFSEGPPEACSDKLGPVVLELYARIDGEVQEKEGAFEPGFGDQVEKAIGKAREAVLDQAAGFCQGLLRGIPFAVEDDGILEEEVWAEPLGLLFILADPALGPDFGSPQEIAEARVSVAMGLSGICAQLAEAAMGE